MVSGEIAVAVVVVAATVAGALWTWRNGRMRTSRRGAERGPQLTETQLGTPLGRRVTLLQFSSAFCAPCRATRTLLADVAGATDGVTHVEVNVDDRLDLVRLLDVRRTPTVFVLGPDGRIAQQASGQPRRAEVLAAVAEAGGGQPG